MRESCIQCVRHKAAITAAMAVAVAVVVVMVVIEGDGWRSAATALVIVVPVGWIRWMDSLFRSVSRKFVERAETVVAMVAVEAVEGEAVVGCSW